MKQDEYESKCAAIEQLLAATVTEAARQELPMDLVAAEMCAWVNAIVANTDVATARAVVAAECAIQWPVAGNA